MASASTAKNIDDVSVNFTKIKKNCAKSGLCMINILRMLAKKKKKKKKTILAQSANPIFLFLFDVLLFQISYSYGIENLISINSDRVDKPGEAYENKGLLEVN